MKRAAGLRDFRSRSAPPGGMCSAWRARPASAASSLAPVPLRCCARLRPPYTTSGATTGVFCVACRCGITAEVATVPPRIAASARATTATRPNVVRLMINPHPSARAPRQRDAGFLGQSKRCDHAADAGATDRAAERPILEWPGQRRTGATFKPYVRAAMRPQSNGSAPCRQLQRACRGSALCQHGESVRSAAARGGGRLQRCVLVHAAAAGQEEVAFADGVRAHLGPVRHDLVIQ